MKKKEMFEANDGTLFSTETAATKHDELIAEFKRLEAVLGGKISDEDCSFANGDGYYQLSKSRVDSFDSEFLAVLRKQEPWIFEQYIDKPDFNKGVPYTNDQLMKSYILGRCLSDSNSILYRPFSMRYNIDSQLRRWGQAYYALNPYKGKQVKLGEFL